MVKNNMNEPELDSTGGLATEAVKAEVNASTTPKLENGALAPMESAASSEDSATSVEVSAASSQNVMAPVPSVPASSLFQLRDATVMRAGKPILAVDSFVLNHGEHLALLGPNGSGKSTFVRLLTREVLPLYRDRPPVLLDGRERMTLAEAKRLMGVVSATMQDQISVHLAAKDVVAGGLFGSVGLPHREDEERVVEARSAARMALDLVGIADLADRDVMTLSTGQARRVLIARALVHDPEVLVLDEPCTGLDPEGMYYVRRTMRSLARAGKTIVLVTHYPEDIIPEIDRVVLLKDGRVFADGSKNGLLTDEFMSDLYGVPLRVEHREAPLLDTVHVEGEVLPSARDRAGVRTGEETSEATVPDTYFSLVSAY